MIPSHSKSKYFIAIVPPSPSYEEALEWKKFFQSNFNSKAALRSPPHITLHMPFEWKNSKAAFLQESLNKFSQLCTPFEFELKNFGCFPPRVIFVEVTENPWLKELQNRLTQHCKSELNLFNANRKDLPYNPHLTVAFRDLKKSVFPEAWQQVKNEVFHHCFTCNGFALLKHNGKQWETNTHFNFPQKSM